MPVVSVEATSWLWPALLAAGVVSFVFLAGLMAFVRSRGDGALFRLMNEALREGNPRRLRAIARILARNRKQRAQRRLAFYEATALLWEGKPTRALSVLDQRVGSDDPVLGIRSLILRLECLLFDERLDEAKALFDSNVDALRSANVEKATIVIIDAFIRFHAGDLDGARKHLESAFAMTHARDPILRAAHFCLAGIAHRQERRDDMRRHLARAIVGGGDLFITRWALLQWEELIPTETPPKPFTGRTTRSQRRATRSIRDLLHNLRIGFDVLRLGTRTLATRRYETDQIAALALLSLGVTSGLRLVEYTSNAAFVGVTTAIAILVPVLAFFLTAHVAATRRHATLRLLGGFYAALPPLLVLAFIGTRIHERYWPMLGTAIEIGAGVWSLAIVLRIARSIGRSSLPRLVVSGVLYVATCLLPMHLTSRTPLFYTFNQANMARYEERKQAHDEAVFVQADRVREAEAQIVPSRDGIEDLYFVGAAGWADQDVFTSEVESARSLFDNRFDTRGRSIVLANDPSTRDKHPLAATVTLHHVLKTVGSRMNTDEDVLFLFVTSHGSSRGLALGFSRAADFDHATLSPTELRWMLDESRIKWRVLVIAGCESGVFIHALQSDFSLVATAAATDRPSYGCATGNAYTDFGRAVFAEQLPKEMSFPTAFANAVQSVAKTEEKEGLRPSQPQVFQGSMIGPKLDSLQRRLASPMAN